MFVIQENIVKGLWKSQANNTGLPKHCDCSDCSRFGCGCFDLHPNTLRFGIYDYLNKDLSN